MLTLAQTRHVARLARLALTDAELEDARARLAAVMGYMERLKAVDLAGVEPLTGVGPGANRLRADTPGPTLPSGTPAALAPARHGEYVRIPRVLGEGGGA